MKCTVCGVEFDGRADAKYCSPKCRKEAFTKRSVGTDNGSNGTDNFLVEERIIPEQFEFRIIQSKDPIKYVEAKDKIRKALYWYDVPIAAVPVIKKDYPQMPDFMNARQYFLWWKNEFKMKGDKPVLVYPFRNPKDVKSVII